jgi:hypothetical protein
LTKKDYQLIAGAIASTWCNFEDQKLLAESIAKALETTNPLFDKIRFLAACGVIEQTEKRKATK